MDAHLADLSRSVDPSTLGRRLRAARIAAGLTQVEVAGGEVTAAYVSRIEGGQRRPGPRLLEHLAWRAGTTAHELLTGTPFSAARAVELAVEHAAITVAFGDPVQALTEIDDALARARDVNDRSLELAASRVRAEVLRVAGSVDAAIETLEGLVADSGCDLNTLRSLVALCRCHCDRGDGPRAVATGRRARRLADELDIDGLADVLQLGAALAQAHLLMGEINEAHEACAEALRRFSHNGSPMSAASAYRRASSTEAAAHGPTPDAVGLAKAALALIDIDESNRSMRAALAAVARISSKTIT